MKSFVAAAVAATFMGAMFAAQAGVPTTPAQPHVTKTSLSAQPAADAASPKVPGAQGAQHHSSNHIVTYSIVGGLVVVGCIILCSSGNSHSTSGTSGTTGTTGTN